MGLFCLFLYCHPERGRSRRGIYTLMNRFLVAFWGSLGMTVKRIIFL